MQKPENEPIPVEDEESAAGDAAPADETIAAAPQDGLARQLDEQRDKYLRLAAEFDNYRKRANRERLEAAPRAQAELVKQLIDPLDDLMRFAHLDPAQVDAKTVVDGVSMVEKKLLKAFAAAGITLVDPAGQPFDPNQHEAVSVEPAASADEDDTVARVFQVGYLANGQLLRPARVVVKQWNG
ncbi:MAG TPA: nucleotide exchange factor GrpE [Gemmatimonadaceae bacterium]|nr:nucleotide exchange factor GrpE [Gemmatimonadaceae bacterium]